MKKDSRLSCGVSLSLLIFVFSMGPSLALDSSDLSFYLSFDRGIEADYARGQRAPAEKVRANFGRGLFGNALKFGRKGFELKYFTHGNVLPASGAVCFWISPLNWQKVQDGPMENTGQSYFRIGGPMAMAYNGVVNSKFANINIRDSHGYKKGQWTFLAASWRQGEFRTYVDGRQAGEKNFDYELPASLPETFLLGPPWTGSSGASEKDRTLMDEFMIFNRALSQEEIFALFTRGNTKSIRALSGIETEMPPPYAMAPAIQTAGKLIKPPLIDANIGKEEWNGACAFGGFINPVTGVVENENEARVLAGYDDAKLYLAIDSIAPEEAKDKLMWPTGVFKSDARGRDREVLEDDAFEFLVSLPRKKAPVYSIAVNARGAMRDSRDGDASWNAQGVKVKSAGGRKTWKAEVSVPLSELGIAPDVKEIRFNVRRIWRMVKHAETFWSVDAKCQPVMGVVHLGSRPAFQMTTLGNLSRGKISFKGKLSGKPGSTAKLQITCRDISESRDIRFPASGEESFIIEKNYGRSTLSGLSYKVASADGEILAQGTIPFATPSRMKSRLSIYPTRGLLDVHVDSLETEDLQEVSADVSLLRPGEKTALASGRIKAFDKPVSTVRLSIKDIPAGKYEVIAGVKRGGRPLGTVKTVFEKKPKPMWLGNKLGILGRVPAPWTDMSVKDGSISCWGRQYRWDKTLFPSQVVSNGEELLSSPMRLVMKQRGRETVLTQGKMTVTERSPRRISLKSRGNIGAIAVVVSGWIEYDGLSWFDVALLPPAKSVGIDSLSLEIPFRKKRSILYYSGSYTGKGTGFTGSYPRKGSMYSWLGDDYRGIQYYLHSLRGWVLDDRRNAVDILPGENENVIRFNLINKPFTLTKERSFPLALTATPVRPRPKDLRMWRFTAGGCHMMPLPLQPQYKYKTLAGGWNFFHWHYFIPWGAITNAGQAGWDQWEKTGRFPVDKKLADAMWKSRRKEPNFWNTYYMQGPCMWNGSPEYAYWWQEWKPVPPMWGRTVEPALNPLAPPTPSWTGNREGTVCPSSSAIDLSAWLLADTVKHYPITGLYCDGGGVWDCMSPYHGGPGGCGYVDEKGKRHTEWQLLSARKYYRRLANIMKEADPTAFFLVHNSGAPIMAAYSSFDAFYEGEQFAFHIGNTGAYNYYDWIGLDLYRAEYCGKNFGVPVIMLPEFGVWNKNHPLGTIWMDVLGHVPDSEHLEGLAFVTDSAMSNGNAFMLPLARMQMVEDEFGWDESVKFIGYWENSDYVQLETANPEKVVASIYIKPPGENYKTSSPEHGLYPGLESRPPKLLVFIFNNTDKDENVVVKLNLKKLGMEEYADGVLRDAYRCQDWKKKLVKPPRGDFKKYKQVEFDGKDYWLHIKGVFEKWQVKNGAAKVKVRKRSFACLFLEKGR